MANSIQERKQILGVYARVYYHLKMNEEPSYPKVAAYLNDYSSFTKVYINEFKAMGKKISEALGSLHVAYVENLEVNQLRANGIHTILSDSKKVTLPSDSMVTKNSFFFFLKFPLNPLPLLNKETLQSHLL